MRKLMLALALLPLTVHAADPRWIEYGPDGAIARTIVTDGGQCPSITIDGVTSPMHMRAEAGKLYEVTSCEANLPANVQSASIGDHALPIHKLGRTAKVAIIGDTGCRRKKGSPVQNCKSGWPFPQIAQEIAEWDPDLVLHVGDYYYREADCDQNGKCQSVPYDWKRWNKDFFDPAAPLLKNAPWVFVRGNHEECTRAAEGWFRFLDARPFSWESTQQCSSNLDFTPAWVANVGTLQILVLDTSTLGENEDDQQAMMIAGQLKLFDDLRPGAWLATHDPFWAALEDNELVTPTLWKAWSDAGGATAPIALTVTGHIHLLEMLTFDDGRPPQALIGNSGTLLDSAATDPTGQQIGGRTVKSFLQNASFGFVTATPSANGWTFDIRDAQGNTKTKCAVTATAIVCD